MPEKGPDLLQTSCNIQSNYLSYTSGLKALVLTKKREAGMTFGWILRLQGHGSQSAMSALCIWVLHVV